MKDRRGGVDRHRGNIKNAKYIHFRVELLDSEKRPIYADGALVEVDTIEAASETFDPKGFTKDSLDGTFDDFWEFCIMMGLLEEVDNKEFGGQEDETT